MSSLSLSFLWFLLLAHPRWGVTTDNPTIHELLRSFDTVDVNRRGRTDILESVPRQSSIQTRSRGMLNSTLRCNSNIRQSCEISAFRATSCTLAFAFCIFPSMRAIFFHGPSSVLISTSTAHASAANLGARWEARFIFFFQREKILAKHGTPTRHGGCWVGWVPYVWIFGGGGSKLQTMFCFLRRCGDPLRALTRPLLKRHHTATQLLVATKHLNALRATAV